MYNYSEPFLLHRNRIWVFPLVIGCHFLLLSKLVRYLRMKIMSHGQYMNLVSSEHLTSKEPSSDYMAYRTIIWSFPGLWDFIWHLTCHGWLAGVENNCVRQTLGKFIKKLVTFFTLTLEHIGWVVCVFQCDTQKVCYTHTHVHSDINTLSMQWCLPLIMCHNPDYVISSTILHIISSLESTYVSSSWHPLGGCDDCWRIWCCTSSLESKLRSSDMVLMTFSSTWILDN